jgi:dolichol-phosphate mannosyltransferase
MISTKDEKFSTARIAVVIPCYRVTKHILAVLSEIGEEVDRVYVVDDCCPDKSGDYVKNHCADHRVVVLHNVVNLGVGGAVLAGYRAALKDGMDIVVKVDGDGQMDPSLIPAFVAPIVSGAADYTKGNRFFSLDKIRTMPALRIFGNATLSFLTKLSSGYWDLFDPTNGFTAIHRDVALHLPFDKISNRYFFETDMLFRLNSLRAVVFDIPMDAKYGDEKSNLKIRRIVFDFTIKHLRNFAMRIFYQYYLRDMSLASFELPIGLSLFVFGSLFGAVNWVQGIQSGTATLPGTIMVSALPVILGTQLLLAFLGHDISSSPKRPFQTTHLRLPRKGP